VYHGLVLGMVMDALLLSLALGRELPRVLTEELLG